MPIILGAIKIIICIIIIILVKIQLTIVPISPAKIALRKGYYIA
jgi:hypothetical protein